jgi:signal transduction histidine kinase/CheY-like chemotaxis protein
MKDTVQVWATQAQGATSLKAAIRTFAERYFRIPHSLIKREKSLRRFNRPGLIYFTVLTLLISSLADRGPFEPYDWIQQWFTASLNMKPYKGDAVIISADPQGLQRNKSDAMTSETLGTLIDKISLSKPKRIIIFRLPYDINNYEQELILSNKLQKLIDKPIVLVDLSLINTKESIWWTNLESSSPIFSVRNYGAKISQYTIPSSSASWNTPIGPPVAIAPTVSTNIGRVMSASQIMADQLEPIYNMYPTDISYDPSTIINIKASMILSGQISQDIIKNKQVVIDTTSIQSQDNSVRFWPGHDARRSASLVIGAQTLIDGPPVTVGSIPSLIVAFIGLIGWLYFNRPKGRLFVVLIFIAIMISPLFLERMLIFQSTSNAIFLMIFASAGKLWINSRVSIKNSRHIAETKSWFLAQASHDLRQPIHAIGMLSARLAQTELTPAQADLVSKIDRSIEGASQMFRSLLDIATIESGTLKPTIAAVSVNEILAEIEEQNALLAERAGVTIRFLPSELILRTDRVLTVTMLQNIVSNAIKYASGKKVLVGCRRQGNNAALCVYDLGTGIADQELRLVKTEFYRATSKTEGTGLGLAIVQRLAALMGLKFTLRSNPGHGTGAIISGFLLGKEDHKSQPVMHATPSHLLVGMKVALADDDVDALRATEALLQQWGCVVEAHECYPDNMDDCDIIISDFDFGRGQTLALFQERIGAFEKRGMPTIVLSGHQPDTVRAVLNRGDIAVLTKPLRPAELRSVLLANRMTR